MIRAAIAGVAVMATSAWLAAVPPPPQVRRTGEVQPPRHRPVAGVRIRRDDAALARAFAAAAARRDGRPHPPVADPEAMALAADADLLAAAEPPPLAGPALPIPLPGGAEVRPLGDPAPAARTNPDAVRLAADLRRLPPPGPRQPPAVVGDLRRKVIVRAPAVAMVVWDPATVPGPIEISDRSGGGHGIRFDAMDVSGLRLDGGLVVPGRLYRLDGRARIDSDVPVRIEIRPLAAASAYWEGPLVIPVGGG
ncbi:MAG: hypothetical protein RLZZ127_704 [Planctomycetota bacterium]|jgi:hypothetical protein